MSAIITDWEEGKGDEGGFVFEMKNKSIQFALQKRMMGGIRCLEYNRKE
jgi:hypothetical protein